MLNRIFLAAIVLFAHLHSYAQEPASPTDNAVVTEATHNSIRELRDGLLKAVIDKDADAILSYLHDDVVLTAQSGTELKTHRKQAGVRAYLEELLTGSSPGVKELLLDVKVDELTILHGEDTGIAFGSSDDHYVLSAGGEFDLATRWTATLVKKGPAWKIANLHVSSNLFDNPVVDASKKVVYLAAGVAAILGIIVVALLFRKRKA
jgi:ketosteroid isomerase-like protein